MKLIQRKTDFSTKEAGRKQDEIREKRAAVGAFRSSGPH